MTSSSAKDEGAEAYWRMPRTFPAFPRLSAALHPDDIHWRKAPSTYYAARGPRKSQPRCDGRREKWSGGG